MGNCAEPLDGGVMAHGLGTPCTGSPFISCPPCITSGQAILLNLCYQVYILGRWSVFQLGSLPWLGFRSTRAQQCGWGVSTLPSFCQASLLAWMAFCLHKASELAKATSNQAANLVLMLGILALSGLVASKFSILVARDDLVVFWNLGAFLVGLGRYSVGPKTLSGILG